MIAPKLLELLEAGHLDVAAELEREHRRAGGASTDDAALQERWGLACELLAVARDLPRDIVTILAGAIAGGGLATARSALEAYRARYTFAALNASSVLTSRAPRIAKGVQGILAAAPRPASPPPVVRPPAPYIPPQPIGSRVGSGSRSGGWIAVRIAIALTVGSGAAARSCAHSTPDYSYTPNYYTPPVDYSDYLPKYAPPAPTEPEEPSVPAPPIPPEVTNQSNKVLMQELIDCAAALQTGEFATADQKAAAGTLEKAARAKRCPAMRKALIALDAAPASDRAVLIQYADSQIDAIHERIDRVCPSGK